jgi:hypothetical protein
LTITGSRALEPSVPILDRVSGLQAGALGKRAWAVTQFVLWGKRRVDKES